MGRAMSVGQSLCIKDSFTERWLGNIVQLICTSNARF